MNHPFQELRAEYTNLLQIMRITKPDEVNSIALRLLDTAHRPHLEPVCAATGVPLPVWATLCERESGCRFDRNPAQGDPLTGPSIHVPRGRPLLGDPPNDHFPVSYEYAAIDAINYDHLNDLSVPAWSMVYACWKGEAWNGFGPRNHGRHTGYLWSGTSLYDGGKYVADGKWNPNAWDQQIGIVPVMLRMIEIDPSLQFGTPIVQSPPIVPAQGPVSVPTGLGTNAEAILIQHALNAKGFGPLIEDGSYGRRTREAVRAFQMQNNITPFDGLAGPKTLPSLLKM